MYYEILGFQLSSADIIGFSISSIAAIVAIISIYYLYHSSKILGGIIGDSLKKISIGIIFTIMAVAFLGLAFGPLNQYEEVYVAIIGPTTWLIGNIFLFFGFKGIFKIKDV